MKGQQERRAELRERIDLYYSRSRTGLWGVLIFLFMSALAVLGKDFNLLAVVSEPTRRLLGAPPHPDLVSIALIVYSFSALILLMGRMMDGDGRYRGWGHLGFLGGFYFFFWIGGHLEGNFWAVFAAGLTILGLEYYRNWAFWSRSIRKERELLRSLGEDVPAAPP